MIALSTGDRTRLAKLLALCSSGYDGEALAAARAADRFVHDHGLTWAEVFGVGQPEAAPAANRNLEPWRETVAACLRQPSALRQWEGDFLRSLIGFARISLKQRAVLDQIAERVLRRAA
jgi:hypothetical protein